MPCIFLQMSDGQHLAKWFFPIHLLQTCPQAWRNSFFRSWFNPQNLQSMRRRNGCLTFLSAGPLHYIMN